ncbi:MAG: hypothetical protein WCG01_02345 [bacterium]
MENRELQIILKAVDEASGEIKKVGLAMNNMNDNVKQSSDSFGVMTKAVAVGNLAYNAFASIVTKVASGFTDLVKESIGLSGQLEQSKAVIYNLGKNNDWTRQQIDGLVKSIRDENKDMLTAIDLTKTAIMTHMNEKQALELVTRGRDVAAASNKNSNDAIKAMMESIIKLRPELLSEYGIEVNLIKVYGDFSKALGIKTSQMTYAQKTQAMYNAVVQEATRMQGSYHEAMGSWYKLSMSVQDGIVSLKLILGDLLDDAMKPLVTYVYEAIKSFRNWAYTSDNEVNPKLKETARLIGQVILQSFQVMRAIVIEVIDVYKKLSDLFKDGMKIINDYKGLLDIFQNSWNNIALVFRQNLSPELQKLWQALLPLQPFLETLAKVIGIILLGALIAVTKIIEVNLIVLIQGLTVVIEKVVQWINFFKAGWESVTGVISSVIGYIDNLINKLNSLNIVSNAKNAVSGMLGFGGARAGGGSVFGGQAYLVGEQGPELFVPSGGGNIVPNNRLGGSGSIVINMSGNTFLDRQSAEKIGDMMIKKLKASNLLG